jgi:phosphoglycolate phosphatase-like HAD superfamily hydrolase
LAKPGVHLAVAAFLHAGETDLSSTKDAPAGRSIRAEGEFLATSLPATNTLRKSELPDVALLHVCQLRNAARHESTPPSATIARCPADHPTGTGADVDFAVATRALRLTPANEDRDALAERCAHLRPWPDARDALTGLRHAGLRVGLLCRRTRSANRV